MVTITDIAAKLKVSPATVSRVLNGNAEYIRPSFSRRAEKIRKTAARLGYRPNSAAQTMRSGRHRCVSLLASQAHWNSSLSGELLIGMQKTLAGLGYNMMLNVLPEDRTEAGKELPSLFKEHLVDGILIGITHSMPEWLESLIDGLELPKVWIGSKHRTDCIHHDDFGAAYGITGRLIRSGHARIAYLDIATCSRDLAGCHFSVLDRMEGYLKAMKEAGLKPRVVRPQEYLPLERRVPYARDNLFNSDLPTAVISYDMPYSGKAFFCNAWQKGIQIPGDISFVAFSEGETYEDNLKITSFTPRSGFAGMAAKLLYDKINNGDRSRKPVVLPFDFIEGNTLKECNQRRGR